MIWNTQALMNKTTNILKSAHMKKLIYRQVELVKLPKLVMVVQELVMLQ